MIAAPWIFGFSDNDTATTLSIIVGAIVLVTGMTTRWRMSLVKLISLHTHFMMDLGVGLALIVLPFVAGFSDEVRPASSGPATPARQPFAPPER